MWTGLSLSSYYPTTSQLTIPTPAPLQVEEDHHNNVFASPIPATQPTALPLGAEPSVTTEQPAIQNAQAPIESYDDDFADANDDNELVLPQQGGMDEVNFDDDEI